MFELIKKHSTHFSEQIKTSSEHLDEVIVSGKVTAIIPPLFEDDGIYALEIDDCVGTIYIHLSSEMIEYYKFIQKDKYISVNGYVNVLRRKIKDNFIKDTSVFGFKVEELKVEEYV